MTATIIALSRADICARSMSMPPHSRGRRAIEAMAREVTHAEMRAMFDAVNGAMESAALEMQSPVWASEFRAGGA